MEQVVIKQRDSKEFIIDPLILILTLFCPRNSCYKKVLRFLGHSAKLKCFCNEVNPIASICITCLAQ